MMRDQFTAGTEDMRKANWLFQNPPPSQIPAPIKDRETHCSIAAKFNVELNADSDFYANFAN